MTSVDQTTRTKYDYVIVGAGIAGGMVADQLTRAGKDCVVLEAGEHFRSGDFPLSATQQSRLFWAQGMEFTSDGRLFIVRGKCVGGSSVVNQALLDRLPDFVWDRWRRRSGVSFLSYQEMNPVYDRLLGDGFFEHRVLQVSQRNRNALLFADGMARKGWRIKSLHRAQADCKGNCMDCLNGCPEGSKQSSLVTSLRRAQARGLPIVSEFRATRLTVDQGGVRVEGRKNGQKTTFSGRNVILAGGSVGTTELLLRSGFKPELPALGEGFFDHPQYYSCAEFDEPVDGHLGAFQTVASDEPKFYEQGFKLENMSMPPDVAGLCMPKRTYANRLMHLYRNLAWAEVMVRDGEPGRLSVGRLTGMLKITKPVSRSDIAKREQGQRAIEELFRSVGAKTVVHSWLGLSVHPMGGCTLGVDPKSSVVNEAFHLHGFPSISVVDSSLFPDAPGFNPSLTVMALSLRANETILQRPL
jgi:choline dehydrogenase-like flavoprotein